MSFARLLDASVGQCDDKIALIDGDRQWSIPHSAKFLGELLGVSPPRGPKPGIG